MHADAAHSFVHRHRHLRQIQAAARTYRATDPVGFSMHNIGDIDHAFVVFIRELVAIRCDYDAHIHGAPGIIHSDLPASHSSHS